MEVGCFLCEKPMSLDNDFAPSRSLFELTKGDVDPTNLLHYLPAPWKFKFMRPFFFFTFHLRASELRIGSYSTRLLNEVFRKHKYWFEY
jgi:hypothetical protein